MSMSSRAIKRAGLFVVLSLSACTSAKPGTGNTGGTGAPGLGTPGTNFSGTAAAAAPPAGSFGTNTSSGGAPAFVPSTGSGGAPMVGTGGTGAGGNAGLADMNGGAGASGAGGMAAGGAGGAGGGTGGGSFIREKDPTEQSVTGNGEYTVKSYTEKDGLVGGTAYGDAAGAGDGSELYYPMGATPPFAAVVIVPGFTAQRSDIAPWCPLLASHGIVCLAIDTNNVADTPDVRAMALADALDSLKKENMRDGSAVKGQLDTTHLGVMGWSMGGGGTWLTADAHPELKVDVSLCGWITGAVGTKTTVPSLQLAVQDDQLAAGMSQPVYMAIPAATPKMLIEWSSGGHWINNDPANENKQVGRYGLSWIKVFLEGDDRYRQFLKTMPMTTSDFKTNQM